MGGYIGRRQKINRNTKRTMDRAGGRDNIGGEVTHRGSMAMAARLKIIGRGIA
jgi:hypothetical protein